MQRTYVDLGRRYGHLLLDVDECSNKRIYCELGDSEPSHLYDELWSQIKVNDRMKPPRLTDEKMLLMGIINDIQIQ